MKLIGARHILAAAVCYSVDINKKEMEGGNGGGKGVGGKTKQNSTELLMLSTSRELGDRDREEKMMQCFK